MGDDVQSINPTKLASDQAILLRQLLEFTFKNESNENQPESVWHKKYKDDIRIYTVTVSDRGFSTQKKLELTHDIIHQKHFNVVTGEVENRYAVYLPDEKPIKGHFASVYDVIGELIPDNNNGLKFKPKLRKVKVQKYIDESVNKNLKVSNGDILKKENIVHESDMSQYATHLHAAPVTFDKTERTGYLTMKKFFQQRLSDVLTSGVSIDVKSRLELSCQLLYSLKYQFHNKNIIHRDIKPENIIVTSDLKANFIDMGFSKKLDEENHDLCGTPGFAAPEVFSGVHSVKSDIYALGITLGLLWGGDQDKDAVNEIGQRDISRISRPIICNLFKNFASSLLIDSVSKDKIKSIIYNMTSYNINNRPDISEAVSVFDDILTSLKCLEIPDEFHESFIDSHKCALDLRDKVYSDVGSFENIYIDLKSKLKSSAGGIYSYHDEILAGTNLFDRICNDIKSTLKLIPENIYSVNEFKQVMQVNGFAGELSKNEIIAIVDYTANEYREMMARIETLILNSDLTSKALTSGSSQYPNYNNDVNLINLKLKKFWYKLIKHRADFDKMQEILASAKKDIAEFETSLESITSFIADERATIPFVRKRVKSTEASLSALGVIKNKVRVKIKDYLDKSGLLNTDNNTLTVFRQVSPKQRFRDINDILDVVDYAVNEDQLRDLLKSRLDNLPTGFAGRSELRKAIKNAINLDIAISRSITSSPQARKR